MFDQLQSFFSYISVTRTQTETFHTLHNPYILSDDVLFSICTDVAESSTRDALNMAYSVSIFVSCVPNEIS